jgi:hypothetical protein
MVTVRELIRWTRSFKSNLISNASRVRIKFLNVTMENDSTGDFKQVLIAAHGDSSPRKAIIKIYGSDHNAKVWLSCDCPWWCFAAEWAVNNRSSTDIIYCNGNPPDPQNPLSPNPDRRPHLCKHLLAAFMKGALIVKSKKDNRKKR